jgi:hypothetical protein
MTALPGLLIEYLVNGAVCLLWLTQTTYGKELYKLGSQLPVLVLVVYVAGMAIDLLAFGITRQPKHWLRQRVERRYGQQQNSADHGGTMRQARIALYAPELNKELGMRSSRDRIARGLIVNSLLCLIFVDPRWIGLIAVVISSGMWFSFEWLSYRYELCADDLVKEKLASSRRHQT